MKVFLTDAKAKEKKKKALYDSLHRIHLATPQPLSPGRSSWLPPGTLPPSGTWPPWPGRSWPLTLGLGPSLSRVQLSIGSASASWEWRTVVTIYTELYLQARSWLMCAAGPRALAGSSMHRAPHLLCPGLHAGSPETVEVVSLEAEEADTALPITRPSTALA